VSYSANGHTYIWQASCASTYTSGEEFVKNMDKGEANSGTSTTVKAQQDPRATGSDTENAKTARRSQGKAKINTKVYAGAATFHWSINGLMKAYW
jgi:hypothetical protein